MYDIMDQMSFSNDSSLILLTYKGKILLMLFENDPLIFNSPYLARDHMWKFIGGDRLAHESFKDAIIKKVKGITGLNLSKVDLLSTMLSSRTKSYLYHAKLTDNQVNDIKRGEGHLLQFFSFKEIESLSLSEKTKLFIEKHREFMEGIGIPQASLRN